MEFVHAVMPTHVGKIGCRRRRDTVEVSVVTYFMVLQSSQNIASIPLLEDSGFLSNYLEGGPDTLLTQETADPE
jgi:hypothetical protein